MPRGDPTTLIIGAAGAVGKRLCAALAARGSRIVASDRAEKLPCNITSVASAVVGGVDVRDEAALAALLKEHGDEHTVVWNLAAPLSVETAMDPAVAEAVTIGGMRNVLRAMGAVGARRICFTDSIGSFGASSPRDGATARWLVDNPGQDPGSDYGRQKRGCRELMAEFAQEHGGDPRFAVLPGVLHSEPVWGNGTTEYALDAMRAAAMGEQFVCPVDPDVTLPMVFVDDLMNGLLALQDADEAGLQEPQNGYAIPGISFTPAQLFDEIRKHVPGFGWRVELNENMAKFAKLWPDRLAAYQPLRDLGYEPAFGLPHVVEAVLAGHAERATERAALLDVAVDGVLKRAEVEQFVMEHMVSGREKHGWLLEREELLGPLLEEVMLEFKDHKVQGGCRISVEELEAWSARNKVDDLVESFMAGRVIELRGGGTDEDGRTEVRVMIKKDRARERLRKESTRISLWGG